jgi:hypothetical protein
MPDGNSVRYSFPVYPTGVPEETLRIINQANGPVGPDERSSDSKAMLPYWNMVETFLAGADAVRKAGQAFLPRFINEGNDDYEYRRKNAKFTNIFRDILEGLCAKPFTKETRLLEESASEALMELEEDIDGQGNHLHVFAAQTFFQGVADALVWILVDKSQVPEGASRQIEIDMGARPYWVRICAKNVLDVRTANIAGRETIIHFRVLEPEKRYDGFKESIVNRVRIYERVRATDGSYGPPVWLLYEETEPDLATGKRSWILKGSGTMGVMKEIPIVPFITGRREGTSWQFSPPLRDAAELQKEHYQQETNLKSAKEATAFPILSGDGISAPVDKQGNVLPLSVGPKSVLYGPPRSIGDGTVVTGSWRYVEPSATSLKFLADEVKATEMQLRELGRQPLTAQTGNLTVITTAFAATKANSAIQSWALGLKDALEQAMIYTTQWLNDEVSEPEVFVHVDFSIDLETPQAATSLLEMRKSRDISRKALIVEAQRRDWLSPEYDADEDEKEIALEGPADPSDEDLANANDPSPLPRRPTPNLPRPAPNPRFIEDGEGLEIEESE